MQAYELERARQLAIDAGRRRSGRRHRLHRVVRRDPRRTRGSAGGSAGPSRPSMPAAPGRRRPRPCRRLPATRRATAGRCGRHARSPRASRPRQQSRLQAAPPPVVTAASLTAPAPQDVAAAPNRPPAARASPRLRRRSAVRKSAKCKSGWRASASIPGRSMVSPGGGPKIATQHYLEARGQPQMPPDRPAAARAAAPGSGAAGRAAASRPACQRIQYAIGADGAGCEPSGRRSFDPFEPVKVAGAEITQWLPVGLPLKSLVVRIEAW